MPVNSARFTFLDPRATTFILDWDHAADDSVAVLRGEAGRNPQAMAVCVNVHCAKTNGGAHRRWTLARLAYEHVASKKSLDECAT